MREETQIHSGLLFLLATAKYLLQSHTDIISYQKFNISNTAQCMNLQGNDFSKASIIKLNYTFQAEYPTKEVVTTNIFVTKACDNTTKIIHFMIDLKELDVRIKLFFVESNSPLVEVRINNTSFISIIEFINSFINMQPSNEHSTMKYGDTMKHMLNDNHMGTTMYEAEPYSSLDLKQLLVEM